MSSTTQPPPPTAEQGPVKVVVYSHSPLFYWWPVWAVGFLVAGVSWWPGLQVAFVPTGTVAERGARVEGLEGKRDILVAPAGQPLPAESESDELKQPRMRMAVSNNPGVIWVMTLFLVIIITHVQLRGVGSLIAILLIGGVIGLLAAFGLWDPILRSARFVDIHINALGYLSISLFLFVIWLLMFLVFDRRLCGRNRLSGRQRGGADARPPVARPGQRALELGAVTPIRLAEELDALIETRS